MRQGQIRGTGLLVRAIGPLLLALALCPVGAAWAQAPTVTIAAPLEGSVSNNQLPSFSGSTSDALDPVTVTIYAGTGVTGAPIQTISTMPILETWSVGSINEALLDGTYTAQASQSEMGESATSAAVTFTVDTVAPAVSIASEMSPTASNRPSFSGEAGVAPGDLATVTLKIYAGAGVSGSPLRTIAVPGSGSSWASGPVEPLEDGTYTAQAEQTDEAGNTSASSSTVFRVDTTPPVITMSSPTSGELTNNRSQLVTGTAGTAEGDSQEINVELFAGSTIGAQTPQETIVVQASDGLWSTTFGGLSDGTYTVRAEQSDEVGNVGQTTAATFTVDTVAPAVTLNPFASPSADPTPGFSGTAGTEAGDLSLVTLKVYAGSEVSGIPSQTIQVASQDGNWASGAVAALEDGTYTLQAEQSDEAGNVGRSAAMTLTIKARGPKVTLNALPQFIGTATPTFSGAAGVGVTDIATVRLKIYAGARVSGKTVLSIQTTAEGGGWTIGPVSTLKDGTYTAQAEQSDELGDSIVSAPSTFTVDTVPPVVSLAPISSPTEDETPDFSGVAGALAGDLANVTVKIYPGALASGAIAQSIDATASQGMWKAAPLAALGAGTYTVQAEQSDEAGNSGRSEPMTFTVIVPTPVVTPPEPLAPQTRATSPAASPPVASFTWFPATPRVGESVGLVSDSTDASGPIGALSWSLSSTEAFQPGGPVLTTSFSAPGDHIVRLQVTGTNGLSSLAKETIPVAARDLSLMQPFPIVRIAGTDTSKGAKLKLLSVQAPAGASISVSCHGHGCPSKSESHIVSSGGGGVGLVYLRRFERTLPAGVVLEIRVFKSGVIGKYTRFRIRRNALPQRQDMCLDAAGIRPMVCPSQ